MQHRFAALVTALVVVSFASVTEARAQTTTTRCLTGSDRLCLRWRFSRRPRARPCRRRRQAFRADSLLPLSAELPERQERSASLANLHPRRGFSG